MVYKIRLTIAEDIVPPDSDIEIKIDFNEGEGSPSRVFLIASDLIRAFEDLDRVLVQSITTKISPQLILEDVEKSSLKIFLKNVLNSFEDDAIKSLDWKKQIGSFLLKGKYAALEWLDKPDTPEAPPRIEELTREIQRLAASTDVRHLPDYPPLNPARLAQPLDAIQRAKSQFRDGEGLVITLDKKSYTVDVDRRWMPSDHLPAAPAVRELSNDVDMVLVVRRPDFLAKAQWQFRHGKNNLSAAMDVPEWIAEFHNGMHPLNPGDALKVRMRFEYTYDENGDLIDEKRSIIRVYEVIKASSPPPGLFDDED